MVNLPTPKVGKGKTSSGRNTIGLPSQLPQTPNRKPTADNASRNRLGSTDGAFDETMMEDFMPLLLTQKNIIKLNRLVLAKNKEIDIRLKQIIQFQDKKHWLKFR